MEVGIALGLVVGFALCAAGVVYNVLSGEISAVRNQRDDTRQRTLDTEQRLEVHRSKIKELGDQISACASFRIDSEKRLDEMEATVKEMHKYYNRVRAIKEN